MPSSSSRYIALAVVLAAVVLALASPHALAQAGTGGIDNWYELTPGQSVEWQFQYGGGDKPALIAFGVDPNNSIVVNVYTDDQWRSLGAGAFPVEPVGRGTPGTLLDWSSSQNLVDNGDLFWEAITNNALLFHIQVNNTTQAPARYWIAQAGPGTGSLAPYAARRSSRADPAARRSSLPQRRPSRRPPRPRRRPSRSRSRAARWCSWRAQGRRYSPRGG